MIGNGLCQDNIRQLVFLSRTVWESSKEINSPYAVYVKENVSGLWAAPLVDMILRPSAYLEDGETRIICIMEPEGEIRWVETELEWRNAFTLAIDTIRKEVEDK